VVAVPGKATGKLSSVHTRIPPTEAVVTLEKAWDILKGRIPASPAEHQEAKLVVALVMLEQYRIDTRNHCEPWFCRRQWCVEAERLLGLDT
jgi:hypothetical protein